MNVTNMRYLLFGISMLLWGQLLAQTGLPDRPIKVITYNIWNGFDWGKDQERHDLFVNWMKEQDTDVAALQELCGYTEEKLKADAAAWGHSYAVILKEENYPVGITSKEPILLKEKALDSFWHGLLHVKTYDIDFFVVHLSPADAAFRMREAEEVLTRIEALENENFMVLGDFNALSPMDADINKEKDYLLERYQKNDDKNQDGYKNLIEQNFDYGVMGKFLGLPGIDICHKMSERKELYSFPTPILIGKYYDDQKEIERCFHRIDFILTDPQLATFCTDAKVIHTETTDQLSDHYPIIATFGHK